MDQLISVGIALALGLLIGAERGWQEREAAEGSLGGERGDGDRRLPAPGPRDAAGAAPGGAGGARAR